MVVLLTEPGDKIKCMAMAFLNGQMDALMKGSISWIKKKAMEYSLGLIIKSMKAAGKMGDSTEQGSILN